MVVFIKGNHNKEGAVDRITFAVFLFHVGVNAYFHGRIAHMGQIAD